MHRGKRHTLPMANPEEAQGIQQPTRMRKVGLVGHRPSGTWSIAQLGYKIFHIFLCCCLKLYIIKISYHCYRYSVYNPLYVCLLFSPTPQKKNDIESIGRF